MFELRGDYNKYLKVVFDLRKITDTSVFHLIYKESEHVLS